MGYCTKCGQKLPDDAFFCTHCGARTKAGAEAGATTSTEEFREAMAKMGQELEKAFSTAAKEIQEAFKTARENARHSTGKGAILCQSCDSKNPNDASFCSSCGKKLDRK